ncbi:hypothetical protein ACPA9J_09655 [Pseudomonas aeruginosa]
MTVHKPRSLPRRLHRPDLFRGAGLRSAGRVARCARRFRRAIAGRPPQPASDPADGGAERAGDRERLLHAHAPGPLGAARAPCAGLRRQPAGLPVRLGRRWAPCWR